MANLAEKMPELAANFARLDAAKARAKPLALPQAMCLDKEWHVLHFLLSGAAGDTGEPAGALMGGVSIGEDVGYGPARLLDSADAHAFAACLESLDLAALVARIDFARMRHADLWLPRRAAIDAGQPRSLLPPPARLCA